MTVIVLKGDSWISPGILLLVPLLVVRRLLLVLPAQFFRFEGDVYGNPSQPEITTLK